MTRNVLRETLRLCCIVTVVRLQYDVLDAGPYLFIHLFLCLAGPVYLAVGVWAGTLVQLAYTAYPASLPAVSAGAVVESLVAVWGWALGGLRPSPPLAACLRRFPRESRSLLLALAAVLAGGAAFRGVPWIAHLAWAGVALLIRAQAPGPPQRSSLRERALTGVLFAVSCAVSLLLLEEGLRLFMQRDDLAERKTQMPHPVRFWTLAPNTEGRFVYNGLLEEQYRDPPFQISSQGLRDVEYDPKAPDEYRILMLGDSFTVGWRKLLEHSVPKQLELALANALPGRRVRVINGGVGGYGPWQSRHLLNEMGFQFEPDLVLHQLFTGNDVDNTLGRDGLALEAYDTKWRRSLRALTHRSLWNMRAESWLFERSHTLWALSTFTGFPAQGDVARLLGALRFLPPGDVPVLPPSAERNPALELDLRTWYPLLEEGLKRMLEDIAGARDDCAARGLDYMTFIVPPPSNVEVGRWEYWMTLVPNRDVYERGKGVRITRGAIEGMGIPCLDTTPALLAAAQAERMYIEYEGHLTVGGARVTAREIAAWLVSDYFRERGLTGETSPPDE